MSDTVECPYCGEYAEVCNDDGHATVEDELYEDECEHCGKGFILTVGYIAVYNGHKAACLNGGAHDVYISECSTWYASKARCKACDYERDLYKSEFLELYNKNQARLHINPIEDACRYRPKYKEYMVGIETLSLTKAAEVCDE